MEVQASTLAARVFAANTASALSGGAASSVVGSGAAAGSSAMATPAAQIGTSFVRTPSQLPVGGESFDPFRDAIMAAFDS